jgi:hypothetical protein
MQQRWGTMHDSVCSIPAEPKLSTLWLTLPCPLPPRLTDADKKRLWEKRYYCHSQVSSLPLVLASAPSWEWACLPDIYALLKQWTHMNHQDALGLLHAT